MQSAVSSNSTRSTHRPPPPTVSFPLDRSYSEWKFSTFGGGGVSGLDYPGLKRSTGHRERPDHRLPGLSHADGRIARLPAVGRSAPWANTSGWAPTPTWQDGIIQVWDPVADDTRFDATQTAANKAQSLDLLSRAAQAGCGHRQRSAGGQDHQQLRSQVAHRLCRRPPHVDRDLPVARLDAGLHVGVDGGGGRAADRRPLSQEI